MTGELLGNRDDIAVLHEHKASGAVVICKRAKRFRSQGDLRVELQRCVEQRQSSVDTAHAIDRDLLDQHLFVDCFVANRFARCLVATFDNLFVLHGPSVVVARGGRSALQLVLATPCTLTSSPNLQLSATT